MALRCRPGRRHHRRTQLPNPAASPNGVRLGPAAARGRRASLSAGGARDAGGDTDRCPRLGHHAGPRRSRIADLEAAGAQPWPGGPGAGPCSGCPAAAGTRRQRPEPPRSLRPAGPGRCTVGCGTAAPSRDAARRGTRRAAAAVDVAVALAGRGRPRRGRRPTATAYLVTLAYPTSVTRTRTAAGRRPGTRWRSAGPLVRRAARGPGGWSPHGPCSRCHLPVARGCGRDARCWWTCPRARPHRRCRCARRRLRAAPRAARTARRNRPVSDLDHARGRDRVRPGAAAARPWRRPEARPGRRDPGRALGAGPAVAPFVWALAGRPPPTFLAADVRDTYRLVAVRSLRRRRVVRGARPPTGWPP